MTALFYAICGVAIYTYILKTTLILQPARSDVKIGPLVRMEIGYIRYCKSNNFDSVLCLFRFLFLFYDAISMQGGNFYLFN